LKLTRLQNMFYMAPHKTAFYSLASHQPHPQLNRRHHTSKWKIYRCYSSRWHKVSSKCLPHKSQWQIPPAPAPTPKRWHCWIYLAVPSVVNLAILLPNVSYVQTILLMRSVKGIRRERLYFPMYSLPYAAFLVSLSKTISTKGTSIIPLNPLPLLSW
jgi:hypothetical protein